MSARKVGGLGRGLGALIPPPPEPGDLAVLGGEGPAPVDGATLRLVPIDAVTPNPRQPRSVFDEDALEELAASLREVGVLQPIVVREIMPGRYELVMGERRWRASRLAGLDVVPAIVRETADDAMLRDALLENLHRQQLNPLEEAAAYDQLLQEFGATHEELAGRIGRSRSHVTNTMRLLGLPPTVQRRVAAGVLSAGHARAILGVEDPLDQDQLATRIVAEGLSVRAVEEIVALGNGREKAGRAPRKPRPPAPELQAIASQLSDQLETRVRVDMGRRKGKITVEFASREDLDRILGAMAGPGVPPA